MAFPQIKYTEIFTENGSTTLTAATVNSKTLVLKALPLGLTAANATTYKVWIGPAATAAAYPLASVNITTKTITVTSTVNLNLATTSIIWVGKTSTPVTAGMSQFYIRDGVIIPANALVRFGSASENFRATNVSTVSTNLVQFTPAVSSLSPSIGTFGVFVGGYLAAATDTLAFSERVSKSGVAQAQTLTLSDSVASYRKFTKTASDAIAVNVGTTAQVTLPVSVSQSITLASSAQGSAAFQSVKVTEAYGLTDVVFGQRKIYVALAESISFGDQAILPMINFSTPKTKVVPPILPDSRGASYMLFRHYEIRERHVNVFRLKDGTFVQDYPTPENSNANVPYPYNPNDPSGLYAYVHNWNGTIEEYHLPNPIVQIFLGGETTMVSQELANELVHAGYAAYLEPVNA
jgi:hypothetical protein